MGDATFAVGVLSDETGIDAAPLQNASRLLEDGLEDRGLFRGFTARTAPSRGFAAERIELGHAGMKPPMEEWANRNEIDARSCEAEPRASFLASTCTRAGITLREAGFHFARSGIGARAVDHTHRPPRKRFGRSPPAGLPSIHRNAHETSGDIYGMTVAQSLSNDV